MVHAQMENSGHRTTSMFTSQTSKFFSSGLVAQIGNYVAKPIRTQVISSTALNIYRHMTHSIESAKLGPYLSVQKQFRGVSVCRQSLEFLGPVNNPHLTYKMSSENPIYGPFFGVMGAASAIIFSGTYSVWTIRRNGCPNIDHPNWVTELVSCWHVVMS